MLLVPMRVKGVMGAGEKVYFEKVLCVNMEDEIQIVAVPEPGRLANYIKLTRTDDCLLKRLSPRELSLYFVSPRRSSIIAGSAHLIAYIRLVQ
jgi:hypothetical protein